MPPDWRRSPTLAWSPPGPTTWSWPPGALLLPATRSRSPRRRLRSPSWPSNVTGTANKLAFVQQPVDTSAGATIPAVTVQVNDSAGHAVHTAGIMVTLQANASVRRLKQLSGTATQPTDASGLATFTSLSISQA